MKYIDNRLNANIVRLEDTNNNYTSENVEGALEEIDSKIKNIEANGYDDTQIKEHIKNIKTEIGTEELTTTDQTIKGAVNEIDSKIKENTNKLKELVTYKIFPTDEQLSTMDIGQVFEVKGIKKQGDIDKCMYIKTPTYGTNSIKKGEYNIKPITKCTDGTLFLPYIGILPGKNNAVSNSNALESANLEFGTILELPAGHYYFDRTINLASRQLILKGAGIVFSPDMNLKGKTFIHFENLAENGVGVNIGNGAIKDVHIVGNSTKYSYSIDREKVFTDVDNMEKENFTIKSYGIKNGGLTNIENVVVSDFYWGCYLESNNIYINNFFARNCHYGLSVGNDTKIAGAFGWDVHTLLQIRGSLSSAVQVRGDSVHHLVELIGYSYGIYLADLDSDFCCGSVVNMGLSDNTDDWNEISDLNINGIRGRCSTLHCYDKTLNVEADTSSITNSEISQWGLISINRKTHLKGANITVDFYISKNPKDVVSNYMTPGLLFCISESSIVRGVNLITARFSSGQEDITKDDILKKIKTLSTTKKNTNISFITSDGIFYYNKDGSHDAVINKVSTEEMI